MNCPKCSQANPDEALYCSKCGAPLNETPATDGFVSYSTAADDASARGAYSAPQTPDANVQGAYTAPSYTVNTGTMYTDPYRSGSIGDPTKDTMTIIGFVCALVSVVCCCFIGLNVILGALGLVFGIIGLKSTKRGLAIASVIIGAIGVVSGLFYIISFIASGGIENLQDTMEELLRELESMDV